MNLLKALKSDLQRTFLSRRYWMIILIYTLFIFFSINNEISIGEASVLYYYFYSRAASLYVFSIIFCTLPFSLSFCEDWNNSFYRSSIIRTKVKSYVWSKIIATSLSAGSAIFLSNILYIVILKFFLPLADQQNINMLMQLQSDSSILLMNHQIWAYILLNMLVQAFACSFMAVFALWISTKITNIFVTIFSPIILYYIWMSILPQSLRGTFLNFDNLIKWRTYMGNWAISILFIMAIMVLGILFWEILFSKNVNRRLSNG